MDRVNYGVLETVDARTKLAGSNRMEILLFSLGTQEIFGINVFKVREVSRTPFITKAPNMPVGVEGLISLRGNVIPVLALAKVMGIAEPSDPLGESMMVTEYSKRTLGFLVHEVDRIIRVEWDKVRAPDNVTSGSHHFITAITELGDGKLVSTELVSTTEDNAVTEIAEAVAKLGRHQFPLVLSESVEQFLTAVSEETGYDLDPTSPDLEGSIAKLGGIARIVGATLRDTANPTMLKAGYKANVIPATAEAMVDCRVLPGRKEAFERELDALLGPNITRTWERDLPSVETTFDGDLVDAMNAAILAVDPDARTVPYMMSGGTDAKAFVRLGIRCFGDRKSVV